MPTLGDRLKFARKKMGYSQIKVMELTGINNKTLSAYEKNTVKPDIDAIGKLAVLYEKSLDYLITGEESDLKKLSDLRDLLKQSDIQLDGMTLTEKERIEINAILTELIFRFRG